MFSGWACTRRFGVRYGVPLWQHAERARAGWRRAHRVYYLGGDPVWSPDGSRRPRPFRSPRGVLVAGRPEGERALVEARVWPPVRGSPPARGRWGVSLDLGLARSIHEGSVLSPLQELVLVLSPSADGRSSSSFSKSLSLKVRFVEDEDDDDSHSTDSLGRAQFSGARHSSISRRAAATIRSAAFGARAASWP